MPRVNCQPGIRGAPALLKHNQGHPQCAAVGFTLASFQLPPAARSMKEPLECGHQQFSSRVAQLPDEGRGRAVRGLQRACFALCSLSVIALTQGNNAMENEHELNLQRA